MNITWQEEKPNPPQPQPNPPQPTTELYEIYFGDKAQAEKIARLLNGKVK